MRHLLSVLSKHFTFLKDYRKFGQVETESLTIHILFFIKCAKMLCSGTSVVYFSLFCRLCKTHDISDENYSIVYSIPILSDKLNR